MEKMDQMDQTGVSGRPRRVDARARRSSLWYLAEVLAVSGIEATPATRSHIISTDTHLKTHAEIERSGKRGTKKMK